jgi:hypothetical protein
MQGSLEITTHTLETLVIVCVCVDCAGLTVVSGMPWQITSLMEVQQDLGKPQ